MSINSNFYPITPESAKKLRQAKLTAAEWRIWSYLIEIDPWGDHYADIDTITVMSECEVSKATYYRAIAKFGELELFDIQDKGFSIRNLCGASSLNNEKPVSKMRRNQSQNCESILKNEKPVSKMRRNSQNCENRGSELSPSKDFNLSQISSDLIRSDPDQIEDLENFENAEAAQSAEENFEISLDEAIAEIQNSISEDLEPDEALNDAETPEEPINPIDGQFSRAAVENFVLKSLKFPPRDRKAYFSRFKPADWQKWELELKASVAPRRDPLAEDPWRLENSIRQAILAQDFDFARAKIENLKSTHPDLAQQLETKFFGGAA